MGMILFGLGLGLLIVLLSIVMIPLMELLYIVIKYILHGPSIILRIVLFLMLLIVAIALIIIGTQIRC